MTAAGRVHRRVARVVRVRSGREIAELIRAVVVPEIEHRPGRGDPDSRRRRQVERGRSRGIALLGEQSVEERPFGRKQVAQRGVGGIAHGLGLARVRPLGRGTAPRPVRLGRDGARVEGRPRVEDARLRDGDRSRDDGGTGLGVPHGLQKCFVPQEHGVVPGLLPRDGARRTGKERKQSE
jgi:hypothetical protein